MSIIEKFKEQLENNTKFDDFIREETERWIEVLKSCVSSDFEEIVLTRDIKNEIEEILKFENQTVEGFRSYSIFEPLIGAICSIFYVKCKDEPWMDYVSGDAWFSSDVDESHEIDNAFDLYKRVEACIFFDSFKKNPTIKIDQKGKCLVVCGTPICVKHYDCNRCGEFENLTFLSV